jgi:tight adherence protein C
MNEAFGASGLAGGFSWELGLIAGAAMATVLLLAAGVRAFSVRRRDEVIERLDRMVGRLEPTGDPEGGDASSGLLGRLARPFAWVARPTQAAELSRLRQRLTQAGLRSEFAMEIFLASKLLLAALSTAAFLYINNHLLVRGLTFPKDAAVAVWLCGAMFFLPNLWLSGQIRKRQALLERALPDAMDLLVTCVEAGLGLDAALSRVADEMHLAAPVLAAELQLTFLEVQAGVPRRQAFRRLADRTGVEDLRQLSAVLTQTEIFGTSIARALRVHADAMRIKRMQKAEERAGMVGVKMTIPLILCILPSLMAIVLGPALVSIYEKLINGGR